ncbi:adenylate/guanylate cyclase domain-containing protein [Isoptericola sp. b441]|uniref:Adenylate/guanylate cyclase domain-containing protein n=1 Tax=Actinotalea lenta TaxID=3064654 RepID=A0ABT9DCA3_9CELL|nr:MULTISPECIES: adenylate/guanylate cyclase domain-containing protein [unclassified Isoptericola]MDO8106931.1 adenylate/guanylate cyclase domain-containing protein [Isoptericola sp. b441]MDO8121358.1 adenylate/guanylate cyclase domain-containing protein [Isoptericola sp. b490]
MAEAAGRPPEDLDQALAHLQDVLLGGPRDLTLDDVARRVGAGPDEVAAFWTALGLSVPASGEAGFTATDADVVAAFLGAGHEYGLSATTGTSLVRAIGHSTERLVGWQTEALVDHLAAKYALSDPDARALLVARLPLVEGLLRRGLEHAWCRHLAAAATRAVAAARGRDGVDPDQLPLARAVGLADVVGFTTRTADLGAAALADYIQEFEAQARDVVTEHGGRVVKTVGDALLFVADDAAAGARVALGLVRSLGPDSDAPLRVGLVWGRVLSRFGDIFGPSVALAARLCDEAGPGRVLVDEATAACLPGFLLDPLEVRDVAGIGPLRPSLLIAERIR